MRFHTGYVWKKSEVEEKIKESDSSRRIMIEELRGGGNLGPIQKFGFWVVWWNYGASREKAISKIKGCVFCISYFPVVNEVSKLAI